MKNITEYSLDQNGWAAHMAEKLDEIGFKMCADDDSYQLWMNYKAMERYAAEKRREIEDAMIEQLQIQQAEGSSTIKADGYKVKVTQRFNRTIDSDALQEIAAENGLTHHLGSLFRWKPDIDAKAWKSAGEEITAPLLAAITTKLGRPSFSIEPETK